MSKKARSGERASCFRLRYDDPCLVVGTMSPPNIATFISPTVVVVAPVTLVPPVVAVAVVSSGMTPPRTVISFFPTIYLVELPPLQLMIVAQ